MPVLLCPFVFQLAPTVLNSSQQVWEGPVLWEPNLRKHNLQRLLRFYPFVLHIHCTLILAFTHWHTDEKKEARNRPEHFNLPVSDIPGKMQRVGVTFSCLKPQSQVFFNHIKLNFFFFFFTTLMVYDVIHHQVWSGNSTQWLSNPLRNTGLRQSPNVITHGRQHFLVRYTLHRPFIFVCLFPG